MLDLFAYVSKSSTLCAKLNFVNALLTEISSPSSSSTIAFAQLKTGAHVETDPPKQFNHKFHSALESFTVGTLHGQNWGVPADGRQNPGFPFILSTFSVPCKHMPPVGHTRQSLNVPSSLFCL